MIIAEENFFIAGEKADEFRENSVYSEIMCGVQLNTGVTEASVDGAFDRLDDGLGICEKAKETFTEFFHENSYDVCCLPKGHSGKCLQTYDKFEYGKFGKKFLDCDQTPGGDNVFFFNRKKRCFPIQITKDQERKLRKEYGKDTLYRACIPIEFSSTNFGCATAMYDLAAVLTLQKGIINTIPDDIEFELRNHAEYLVEYYAEEFNIKITNEGYLCDWTSGQILEPELWHLEGQIQFGHVTPVKSDEYMTRGLNILPMTKIGNMVQGEMNVEEYKQDMRNRNAWLD